MVIRQHLDAVGLDILSGDCNTATLFFSPFGDRFTILQWGLVALIENSIKRNTIHMYTVHKHTHTHMP